MGQGKTWKRLAMSCMPEKLRAGPHCASAYSCTTRVGWKLACCWRSFL